MIKYELLKKSTVVMCQVKTSPQFSSESSTREAGGKYLTSCRSALI